MELKEIMIQEEERLEAHKQLINKIINECNMAEAYLQSKNIFKKITMIADSEDDEDAVELIWDYCDNHRKYKIKYTVVDDLGEIISQRNLLECPLQIRIKMHPFLGDFITHIANNVSKVVRDSNGIKTTI